MLELLIFTGLQRIAVHSRAAIMGLKDAAPIPGRRHTGPSSRPNLPNVHDNLTPHSPDMKLKAALLPLRSLQRQPQH